MKVRIVNRKLGQHKAIGLAWSDGVIEIDSRLTDRRRLTILIHEALHLAMPKATEATVERVGAFLGKIVWADGFRRDPQQVAEQGAASRRTSGPRACK